MVLAMNIVAGRAYHRQTPVFTSEIRTVIFRPYWNVPLTIQRNELVPQLAKHPSYLTENSYEVLDAGSRLSEFENDQKRQANYKAAVALRQRPRNSGGCGDQIPLSL